MSMSNLRQFCENVIFLSITFQLNFKPEILFGICDTKIVNNDLLLLIMLPYSFVDFQLLTKFP